MYVRFRVSIIAYFLIEEELEMWAEKYNIHKKSYKLKMINDVIKLTFKNNNLYSFFCLTWQPHALCEYLQFDIIEPMKN